MFNFEYMMMLCCVLSLSCAIGVMNSSNPVHSILFLMLVFFNLSIVLLFWNAEFIAVIFLIVYVGAISVLFLFVMMMLNLKILELKETFWHYMVLGSSLGIFLLIEVMVILYMNNYELSNLWTTWCKPMHREIKQEEVATIWKNMQDVKTNTESLGWYMYTYSAYLMFLMGLILLVAMMGAIILTLNQNMNVKRQMIFAQVNSTVVDSVKLKKCI